MLSNKITILYQTLNVNSTGIARSLGCSPSNFSRLKKGTRVPKPTSPTVKKFIEGIAKVSEETGKREDVCRLIGATLSCDDTMFKDRLLLWLFDGIELPKRMQKERRNYSDLEKSSLAFGHRLNLLMEETGISNGDLSRMTGMDPSYVSRLRRGSRMPKYHSRYLVSICAAILDTAKERKLTPTISALSHIPTGTLEGVRGASALQQWLFLYASPAQQLAVDHLLSSLNHRFTADNLKATEDVPSLDEIAPLLEGYRLDPSQMTDPLTIEALGAKGLRQLVTQFLLDVLEEGDEEIWLYSDRSMDWIDEEYRPVLTSLLMACIRQGVRITIIHNVDRSILELFQAIEIWMPVTLSGQVDSYYWDHSSGDQFSHTIFIRPGKAVIEGFWPRNFEDRCHYRMFKKPDIVEGHFDAFKAYVEGANHLVEVKEDVIPEPGDISIENLLVNLAGPKVVVKRTEAPLLSFSFSHPMVRYAFNSYFQKA